MCQIPTGGLLGGASFTLKDMVESRFVEIFDRSESQEIYDILIQVNNLMNVETSWRVNCWLSMVKAHNTAGQLATGLRPSAGQN